MWYRSGPELLQLRIWVAVILGLAAALWVIRLPLVLWLGPPLLYLAAGFSVGDPGLTNPLLFVVFSLTCAACWFSQQMLGEKRGFWRW